MPFRFFAIVLMAVTASAEEDKGWTVVSRSGDLIVYNRPHKDSSIQEYKAVGLIDAPPAAVKAVIEDTDEFPHFMPYVIEARVISRKPDLRITYQRISAPLVGDRDYTIQIRGETLLGADGGTSYCNKWKAANELGPAAKSGVVRIKMNEGSWLLEPAGDGRQTHATYNIFSDPGGSLPAMVVNAANKTAIPKVFNAIRKQAKLEKYSRKGQ